MPRHGVSVSRYATYIALCHAHYATRSMLGSHYATGIMPRDSWLRSHGLLEFHPCVHRSHALWEFHFQGCGLTVRGPPGLANARVRLRARVRGVSGAVGRVCAGVRARVRGVSARVCAEFRARVCAEFRARWRGPQAGVKRARALAELKASPHTRVCTHTRTGEGIEPHESPCSGPHRRQSTRLCG